MKQCLYKRKCTDIFNDCGIATNGCICENRPIFYLRNLFVIRIHNQLPPWCMMRSLQRSWDNINTYLSYITQIPAAICPSYWQDTDDSVANVIIRVDATCYLICGHVCECQCLIDRWRCHWHVVLRPRSNQKNTSAAIWMRSYSLVFN